MTANQRAAIFDLDGTLVDSLPDLLIALNRLLAEEGRPGLAAEQVRGMVGDGAEKLVERGFAATGAPAGEALPALTRRFLELYEGNAADHTRPWPGVVEALGHLAEAGWRLGVCTNKPYKATVEVLEGLGLRAMFEAVLGGDSVPHKKPDPRHVLATLEALRADPANTVFVGDSPNDVAAARGAGLPVVAVSFGYSRVPAAELGADELIDHFSALPAALARRLGGGGPLS